MLKVLEEMFQMAKWYNKNENEILEEKTWKQTEDCWTSYIVGWAVNMYHNI